MDQVIVRVMDMVLDVEGITVMDRRGDYNIYLNSRYSKETMEAAYLHEIEHIKQGHFYSCKDLEEVEREASEVSL